MYGKVLLGWFVVRVCRVRCYSGDSSKKLLDILATMPKVNTSRIADAQRQRQNINKKSEKYSASHVYLQVIGSGARGAPNTLYLFTDQKRYLFNCGECTQRLSHEHKVKLSRLNDIFITSKTWRNIGGLPGLSLTLQDVGVPNITLHGPEGLDELYNATKRFVIMKDMNVKMAKCSPTEDFEDSVMTVRYVLLGSDKLLSCHNVKTKKQRQEEKIYEEYLHDDTDYYKRQIKQLNSGRPHSSYGRNKSSEIDTTKKKTDKALTDLPYTSNCSVAFICTLKKRLGTLDLEKCVEKGVKPGPLLGQLKAGHDVVLPDGTVVHACDVKTPDDPGPVFIVLEVLDISCLKEIDFKMHFDSEDNVKENIPAIVVHYTPPNVLNHPKYKKFMSMFGPSCQHLILNSQNVCLGSEAVHRTQHKLHLLDSDIFPLLKDVSLPAVWSAEPVLKTDSPVMMKGLEDLKNKIAIAQFQNIINMDQACKGDVSVDDGQSRLNVIAGHSLTMYQLRPKMELDRSLEPKLHVQDYIKETMDVDGFVASLANFRQMVDSIRYMKSDLQIEYPKVVFLGTGSCIPSKTRNVSAIVVHINEDSSLLLDCGEGTFGQLVRFYGPKKVNAFLRTLKGIYISHLHADHHIGLFGVVQARKQALLEVQSSNPPEPLYLLAPGQIFGWLSTYDQQFEKIRSDITLIPNQDLLGGVHDKQHTALTPAMLSALGVLGIQMCLVSHCPNAFGVAIQIDDQYKITYSGDTIPCPELVRIGEGSTVLIHEATMEDELEHEARVKMHSTTSQAIDIGRQMDAQYTVLTHFSQRYARLPRLSQQILNDNKSVGIAFDNMQITMNDLELLPFMYAPLQLMFAEHCVEMELKAEQRARKRERKLSNPILSAVTRNGTRQMKYPVMRSLSPFLKPAAFYRETNASRLRQESRGIVLDSVVAGARSKSLPNKKAIVPHVNADLPTRNPSTTSSSINGVPPSKNTSVRCFNSTIDSPKTDNNRYIIKKNKHKINGRSKTITSFKSSSSDRAKRNAILKSKVADCKELNNTKTEEAGSEKHLVTLVDKKEPIPKPKDIKTQLSYRNNMKPKTDKEIKTKPILCKEAKNLHQNKNKNDTTKGAHSHKSLRQFLDERSLPSNNKSFQPVTIGRSNASSIGSFKPQLEDIKSSFYLINQERLCQLKNKQAKAQKEINGKLKVEKPKPLNDQERKNLLMKSKQKFQSKSYWNDSKYERIEGLNWISWK